MMRTVFSRTLILAAAVLVTCLAHVAQPPAPKAGSVFAGEALKYEGKFSKLRFSFSVAELTFTAALAPNATDLVIKGEAVSKGTLIKIARFSFLQQYESTVDLGNFRILKTTKHDVQKERVRDGEAVFDYGQKRVSYIETDPKDRNRPPRRIASEIGGQMHDMISAIYAVRLLPLAVGQRLEFSVSDSGLVYKVPFTVTAREMQKTILGKVWCFRVEPDIFGPGKLIEQKGKMVIWMSDDERKIPVRAQVDSGFGKIDIKLKSHKKTLHGSSDGPS